MINLVSKKIRNTNSPQQNNKSRSREDSVDSNRSTVVHNNSKGNLHLITNTNNNNSKVSSGVSVPVTPSIPHVPSTYKSVPEDKLITEQLIKKVKQKVMETINPIIQDLTNKIDQIAYTTSVLKGQAKDTKQKISKFHQNMQDFYQNWKQLMQKIECIEERTRDAYNLQKYIIQISEQQSKIGSKIQKITKNQLKQSFMQQLQVDKYLPNNHTSNTNNMQLSSVQKCRCQKLVQQILQSQNHLASEIQYLKHFQRMNNNKSSRQKKISKWKYYQQ